MTDPISATDRRSTLTALAVAVGCGGLWFLASPRLDLWPLAWLAPAPLCWLIDRAPTARRARRYAWLAGTVTSVGGFSWIVGLLSRYSSFPVPLAAIGLLVMAAYQGLIFWLFALVARRVRDLSRDRLGRPLPFVLIAPVLFAAAETAWPLIFPYNLAISQAWQPRVIQIAELTGPVGVTALLFAVGGALYDLISERDLRRRIVVGASAGALTVAVLVYGSVRMAQIDAQRAAAPALAIGLVQTNIPLDGPLAADPAAIRDRHAAMQSASASLEARGAQLIVWPEATLPFALPRQPLPAAEEPMIRQPWTEAPGAGPRFSAPLIAGGLTIAGDDDPPFNSALLLADGALRARYDKSFLVIFSESIPGADTFPWLEELMPRGAGHFSRGAGPAVFALEVDGQRYRVAPMICFEDTLPAFSRGVAGARPQLLVNLTNDTWFGDSSEPWQHLALAVFRAVELRTDMVRAVNSGATGYVDAAGRVRRATDVIDPTANPTAPTPVLVQVRLLAGGGSPFARFGNLFGWLCVAVALSAWQLWPRLRRRADRK